MQWNPDPRRNPVDYIHNAVKYYDTGEQGKYMIVEQLVYAAVLQIRKARSRDTAVK